VDILSTSQYIALNVVSAVLLLAQLYVVTCAGISVKQETERTKAFNKTMLVKLQIQFFPIATDDASTQYSER